MTDVERLLQSALTPVEPSEALGDRLERALSEISDAAADELVDWELSAMGDPRNWARPAAAIVAGTAAAGGLALLEIRRQRRRSQSRGARQAFERRLRDAAEDIRKSLGG